MNSNIRYQFKQFHNIGNCVYAWFLLMHTRIDIVLYGNRDEDEYIDIIERVYYEINRLERLGNCFSDDSELSNVNRLASIHPLDISPTLYDMIYKCKEYNILSYGCFDVTVNSPSYIKGMMDSVIIEDNAIYYNDPNIYINLSGFIKGYALDCIKQILVDENIRNGLINMGNSSVMALGYSPFGEGWSLSLPERTVLLIDECLTTSGNGDFKKRHIFSPAQNKFIDKDSIISVVTSNGAEGEVLSTSLFVAGSDSRKIIIEKFSPKSVVEINK